MNKYLTIKERQQKEVNAFPMFFAFSDEQFRAGMVKLGLLPDETDKIYRLGHTGGYYRKSDAPVLREMFERHERERAEAIAADETGEGYILDMFDYELANHEYCITYDIEPTLNALGLTEDDVNEDPRLLWGLGLAIKKQGSGWE